MPRVSHADALRGVIRVASRAASSAEAFLPLAREAGRQALFLEQIFLLLNLQAKIRLQLFQGRLPF